MPPLVADPGVPVQHDAAMARLAEVVRRREAGLAGADDEVVGTRRSARCSGTGAVWLVLVLAMSVMGLTLGTGRRLCRVGRAVPSRGRWHG